MAVKTAYDDFIALQQIGIPLDRIVSHLANKYDYDLNEAVKQNKSREQILDELLARKEKSGNVLKALALGEARGVLVDLPEIVGRAISVFNEDLGSRLISFAETNRKKYEAVRPEFTTIPKIIEEAGAILGPSVGTGAGIFGATRLAVRPFVKAEKATDIAIKAAQIGVPTTFGLATAQEQYEEGIKRGLSEPLAVLNAVSQGLIEALGEYAGTVALSKLLGLSKTKIPVIDNLLNKFIPEGRARNLIGAMLTEGITEAMQNMAEGALSVAFGTTDQTLSEALTSGAATFFPAFLSPLLLAPYSKKATITSKEAPEAKPLTTKEEIQVEQEGEPSREFPIEQLPIAARPRIREHTYEQIEAQVTKAITDIFGQIRENPQARNLFITNINNPEIEKLFTAVTREEVKQDLITLLNELISSLGGADPILNTRLVELLKRAKEINVEENRNNLSNKIEALNQKRQPEAIPYAIPKEREEYQQRQKLLEEAVTSADKSASETISSFRKQLSKWNFEVLNKHTKPERLVDVLKPLEEATNNVTTEKTRVKLLSLLTTLSKRITNEELENIVLSFRDKVKTLDINKNIEKIKDEKFKELVYKTEKKPEQELERSFLGIFDEIPKPLLKALKNVQDIDIVLSHVAKNKEPFTEENINRLIREPLSKEVKTTLNQMLQTKEFVTPTKPKQPIRQELYIDKVDKLSKITDETGHKIKVFNRDIQKVEVKNVDNPLPEVYKSLFKIKPHNTWTQEKILDKIIDKLTRIGKPVLITTFMGKPIHVIRTTDTFGLTRREEAKTIRSFVRRTIKEETAEARTVITTTPIEDFYKEISDAYKSVKLEHLRDKLAKVPKAQEIYRNILNNLSAYGFSKEKIEKLHKYRVSTIFNQFLIPKAREEAEQEVAKFEEKLSLVHETLKPEKGRDDVLYLTNKIALLREIASKETDQKVKQTIQSILDEVTVVFENFPAFVSYMHTGKKGAFIYGEDISIFTDAEKGIIVAQKGNDVPIKAKDKTLSSMIYKEFIDQEKSGIDETPKETINKLYTLILKRSPSTHAKEVIKDLGFHDYFVQFFTGTAQKKYAEYMKEVSKKATEKVEEARKTITEKEVEKKKLKEEREKIIEKKKEQKKKKYTVEDLDLRISKKTEKRPYNEKEVEKVLRRIKDICPNVVIKQHLDRIILDKEKLNKALKKWNNGNLDESLFVIEGAFETITFDGKVFYGIIHIAQNPSSAVLYHEAFHFAKRFLLNKEENEFLDTHYQSAGGISTEEIQSEAFSRYARFRDRFPKPIVRLFSKLQAFFNAIKRFITTGEFKFVDPTVIFEKFYSGKMTNRYTGIPFGATEEAIDLNIKTVKDFVAKFGKVVFDKFDSTDLTPKEKQIIGDSNAVAKNYFDLLDSKINDNSSSLYRKITDVKKEIEFLEKKAEQGELFGRYLHLYMMYKRGELTEETLVQQVMVALNKELYNSYSYWISSIHELKTPLIFKAMLVNDIFTKNAHYTKEGIKTMSFSSSSREIPLPFDKDSVLETYNKIKSGYKGQLIEAYLESYSSLYKNFEEGRTKIETKEGTWYKFKNSDNFVDTNTGEFKDDEFTKESLYLQAAVQNTEWCTKRMAKQQLKSGDFWLFIDKNKNPRIAIRMERDNIAEVGGLLDNQQLEEEMRPIAADFVRKHIERGEEFLKEQELVKKLIELRDRKDKPVTYEELKELVRKYDYYINFEPSEDKLRRKLSVYSKFGFSTDLLSLVGLKVEYSLSFNTIIMEIKEANRDTSYFSILEIEEGVVAAEEFPIIVNNAELLNNYTFENIKHLPELILNSNSDKPIYINFPDLESIKTLKIMSPNIIVKAPKLKKVGWLTVFGQIHTEEKLTGHYLKIEPSRNVSIVSSSTYPFLKNMSINFVDIIAPKSLIFIGKEMSNSEMYELNITGDHIKINNFTSSIKNININGRQISIYRQISPNANVDITGLKIRISNSDFNHVGISSFYGKENDSKVHLIKNNFLDLSLTNIREVLFKGTYSLVYFNYTNKFKGTYVIGEKFDSVSIANLTDMKIVFEVEKINTAKIMSANNAVVNFYTSPVSTVKILDSDLTIYSNDINHLHLEDTQVVGNILTINKLTLNDEVSFEGVPETIDSIVVGTSLESDFKGELFEPNITLILPKTKNINDLSINTYKNPVVNIVSKANIKHIREIGQQGAPYTLRIVPTIDLLYQDDSDSLDLRFSISEEDVNRYVKLSGDSYAVIRSALEYINPVYEEITNYIRRIIGDNVQVLFLTEADMKAKLLELGYTKEDVINAFKLHGQDVSNLTIEEAIKKIKGVTLFKGDSIFILINTTAPDSNYAIAFHEILEALLGAGYLTEADMAILKRAFSGKKRAWTEEASDAFRDFMILDRVSHKVPHRYSITKIFEKIRDFLNKVVNFMLGYGYRSVNDIFNDIKEGKFKRQGEVVTADETPAKIALSVENAFKSDEWMYHAKSFLSQLLDAIKISLKDPRLKKIEKWFINPQWLDKHPVIEKIFNIMNDAQEYANNKVYNLGEPFLSQLNKLSKNKESYNRVQRAILFSDILNYVFNMNTLKKVFKLTEEEINIYYTWKETNDNLLKDYFTTLMRLELQSLAETFGLPKNLITEIVSKLSSEPKRKAILDKLQDLIDKNYKKVMFDLYAEKIFDSTITKRIIKSTTKKETIQKIVPILEEAKAYIFSNVSRDNFNFDEVIDSSPLPNKYKETLKKAYNKFFNRNYESLSSKMRNEIRDKIIADNVVKLFYLSKQNLTDYYANMATVNNLVVESMRVIGNYTAYLKNLLSGFYFPRIRPQGRWAVSIYKYMQTEDDKGNKIFKWVEISREHTSPSISKIKENYEFVSMVNKYKKKYKDAVVIDDITNLDNISTDKVVILKSENKVFIPEMFEGVSNKAVFNYIQTMINRLDGQKLDSKAIREVLRQLREDIHVDFSRRSYAKARFISRKESELSIEKLIELIEKEQLDPSFEQLEGAFVSGYKTELFEVLRDHLTMMSNSIARMDALYKVDDYIKDPEISNTLSKDKTLFSWVKTYVDSIMYSNNLIMKYSGAVKLLIATWFLGGRISSAFVQLTQPFLTGIPELSTLVEGTKEDLINYRPKEIKLEEVDRLIKRHNEAFKYITNALNDIVKRLIEGKLTKEEEEALKYGFAGRQATQFVNAIRQEVGSVLPHWMTKICDYSLYLFQKAEEISRQAGFLAGYRLAREKGLSKDAAVEFAIKFTRQAFHVYTNINRPLIAVKKEWAPFTSLFTTLKGYQLNYIGWAYNSIKNKHGKVFADKILLSGMYMMLLGGIFAFPFFLEILNLLKLILGIEYNIEKEVSTAIKKNLGKGAGTIAEFGILAPFLGIDLSGSIRLDLLPKEWTFSGLIDNILGIWSSGLYKAEKFKHAYNRGDVYNMIAALSPIIIEKNMYAFDNVILGNKLRTMYGSPIVSPSGAPVNLDLVDTAITIMGFRPMTLSEPASIERATKSIENYFTTKRNKIYEKIRTAETYEKLMDIITDDVNQYNTRVSKYYGVVPLITPQSILRVLKNNRGEPNKLALLLEY